MRSFAFTSCIFACAALLAATVSASAQPTVLVPMSVENYRVLQRVSRNSGWASTAYRNYLVGLFEGLLSSEGEAAGDRHGRLFCLPPGQAKHSLAATFEWMETELNNVVARAQPNTYVARLFVAHLTASYPCKG